VNVDGKWGYIDSAGTIIIAPEFEEAESFSEGVAAVKAEGSWGYIDKSGKFIIPPGFASAQPFYKGIGVVTQVYHRGVDPLGLMPEREERPWAYVNKDGEIVAGQELHVMPGVFWTLAYYNMVNINLASTPQGATVYLVPLYDWENDPEIVNDDRKLARHRLPQGNTDVTTAQPEMVFKGVFSYNGRKLVIDVDVVANGNKLFKVDF
jgi:hypothetical protein